MFTELIKWFNKQEKILFFFILQQDVLELLVKNGADIDAKTKNGETPFGTYVN